MTSLLTFPAPGRDDRGFSLVELLLALVLTLGIGLAVFQMFRSNERTFRDQSLLLEMQQSARAVAALIAGELRKAGQGVPVYSAARDPGPSEAAQPFLDGSTAGTVRFRAGIRNAAATVSNPLTYADGASATITVDDVSPIHAAGGGNGSRYVYLWGPTKTSWTWIRAEITGTRPGANQLTATPRQIGGEGGTFSGPPAIVLEEGISYRLQNGTVLRGTTTAFDHPADPVFIESAVGHNFSTLAFVYYDRDGNEVDPGTLEGRAAIRRVDFTVAAETAAPLSNGSTRSHAVTIAVHPRNAGFD